MEDGGDLLIALAFVGAAGGSGHGGKFRGACACGFEGTGGQLLEHRALMGLIDLLDGDQQGALVALGRLPTWSGTCGDLLRSVRIPG